MGKGSLRRYDVQAKVSFYVSVAAALCAFALMAMLLRNYRSETQTIAYNGRSMYAPIVYLITVMTILLAGTGAAMGAVSAGQKRNTFSKRSWTAFFVGGLSLSLTIILFYAFLTYRFTIT